MNQKIVEAVAAAISKARAEEAGGCFRPEHINQFGECADGNCYCSVWCKDAAYEVVNTLKSGRVYRVSQETITATTSPISDTLWNYDCEAQL